MKNKRALKILLWGLIFWILVHTTLTIIDGLSDNKGTADIGVVLGNKVNEDGTLSERLTKRLECGLDLYKSKRVKSLVVSGGLGKEGYYEGEEMKEFLIKNGVPDSLIIVDNAGNNTMKTVENTLQLKDKLQFKDVIIISQYYHITRTKMLFRKLGFKNISGVSPKYFEWKDLYSLLREFFAYYYELI